MQADCALAGHERAGGGCTAQRTLGKAVGAGRDAVDHPVRHAKAAAASLIVPDDGVAARLVWRVAPGERGRDILPGAIRVLGEVACGLRWQPCVVRHAGRGEAESGWRPLYLLRGGARGKGKQG